MEKLERVKTTWVRWDPKRLKDVISHPTLWIWTDSEGTQRTYLTKGEALQAKRSAV